MQKRQRNICEQVIAAFAEHESKRNIDILRELPLVSTPADNEAFRMGIREVPCEALEEFRAALVQTIHDAAELLELMTSKERIVGSLIEHGMALPEVQHYGRGKSDAVRSRRGRGGKGLRMDRSTHMNNWSLKSTHDELEEAKWRRLVLNAAQRRMPGEGTLGHE